MKNFLIIVFILSIISFVIFNHKNEIKNSVARATDTTNYPSSVSQDEREELKKGIVEAQSEKGKGIKWTPLLVSISIFLAYCAGIWKWKWKFINLFSTFVLPYSLYFIFHSLGLNMEFWGWIPLFISLPAMAKELSKGSKEGTMNVAEGILSVFFLVLFGMAILQIGGEKTGVFLLWMAGISEIGAMIYTYLLKDLLLGLDKK